MLCYAIITIYIIIIDDSSGDATDVLSVWASDGYTCL